MLVILWILSENSSKIIEKYRTEKGQKNPQQYILIKQVKYRNQDQNRTAAANRTRQSAHTKLKLSVKQVNRTSTLNSSCQTLLTSSTLFTLWRIFKRVQVREGYFSTGRNFNSFYLVSSFERAASYTKKGVRTGKQQKSQNPQFCENSSSNYKTTTDQNPRRRHHNTA